MLHSRTIKLCSACKHSAEEHDGLGTLVCSLRPLNPSAKVRSELCSFQRGSGWVHDCGPDGHYWEAKS